MNAIQKWFQSKGGFAHVIAAVFAGAMLAYASVPQFHALVLQIHALLPGWVQEVATTALALYAWYKSNHKSATPINLSSTVPMVLLFLILPMGILTLTGCSTWERTTFQALAVAKADIDAAHAAYEVSATLPGGSCATVAVGTACIPHTAGAHDAITKAVQADTLTVQLMVQYEQDKALNSGQPALTAAQADVTNALASLTTITAEIKALYGK